MGEHPDTYLRIEGDQLVYRHTARLIWTIPVHAIVLIAEHTNDQGPFVDDYFLHFWSFDNDQLTENTVTFYAPCALESLQHLSRILGDEILPGLASSADWASRVLWPPQLASHEYYTFSELIPQSAAGKFSQWFVRPRSEIYLQENVKAFLRSVKQRE